MAQDSTIINLGKSSIQLIGYKGEILSDVLFLNVHEDEQTSILAINKVRQEFPIEFYYLHHEQTRNINFRTRRNIYEFDPNRIYTFKGRKNSLNKFGKFSFKANKEVKKLDLAIKELIANYKVVVTLHNNTDVNYTINSYAAGGDESENTKELYISQNWDSDDFIYTTEKKYFEFFKSNDINVILQDNEGCVNDGSLSVFCGKNNIPYINIEAEINHFNENIALIEKTLTLLKTF